MKFLYHSPLAWLIFATISLLVSCRQSSPSTTELRRLPNSDSTNEISSPQATSNEIATQPTSSSTSSQWPTAKGLPHNHSDSVYLAQVMPTEHRQAVLLPVYFQPGTEHAQNWETLKHLPKMTLFDLENESISQLESSEVSIILQATSPHVLSLYTHSGELHTSALAHAFAYWEYPLGAQPALAYQPEKVLPRMGPRLLAVSDPDHALQWGVWVTRAKEDTIPAAIKRLFPSPSPNVRYYWEGQWMTTKEGQQIAIATRVRYDVSGQNVSLLATKEPDGEWQVQYQSTDVFRLFNMEALPVFWKGKPVFMGWWAQPDTGNQDPILLFFNGKEYRQSWDGWLR